MAKDDQEDKLLRSAAMRNARSILKARQRAERELIRTKEALETRSQELASSFAILNSTLQALSRSEARLVMAMEAGRMGAWEWIVATGQVVWSPTLEAIHGLPPGSFGGRFEDFQRDIHPDDRAAVLGKVQESLANRTAYQVEYRILKPDGSLAWIEARGKPFLDPQGNPERMAGICMDVTSRIQGEDALRQSEEFNRGIIESSGDCIKLVSLDGRLLWISESGQRAIQVSDLTSILGNSWLDFWQEPDRSAAQAALQKAAAGATGNFVGCFPVGGQPRWWDVVITRMYGDATQPQRLLVVSRDITELKRAEHLAQTARDEALAASRAKDDFLAALSHELRTPLNPVLLLASDGAGDTALPADVRQVFETIRKNVELEARLIDDLLDLTAITRGKLRIDRQEIDLHAVLRDAIDTVRPEARAQRIELAIELAAVKPIVQGDAIRLQQIFWNVLKNAVKFTPSGGHVQVVTRVPSNAGHILVEITDTGIGLTSQELARVFAAFVQGDHAHGSGHRFGGLGLGLAISKKLVELHQGCIRAESQGRDRGAKFVIELPLLAQITGAFEDSGPSLMRPEAACADGPGFSRILLVEDHSATRQALCRLLVRRGYQVIPAATLSAARQLAEGHTIDLLISDIGLPDGSGYELMSELRERFNLSGIALTGYGMEADVVRSRAAGFLTHLTKPIRVQALEAALLLVRKSG